VEGDNVRSLQVLTPHMECIYNCPFCISKTHEHDNTFYNNYENDYILWMNNLVNVILENPDLGYVVITGTNEPMQSPYCVKNIINIVRSVNPNIQIEIQTHYYQQNEIFDMLDVVAYSVPYFNLLKHIKPMGKIQRYVLVLTDSFNNYSLNDILKNIPDTVSQVTLKCLNVGNGFNKDVEDYILNHSIDNETLIRLKEEIKLYDGDISIRVDENCMIAENRYKVFREDGNLYDNWDQTPAKVLTKTIA